MGHVQALDDADVLLSSSVIIGRALACRDAPMNRNLGTATQTVTLAASMLVSIARKHKTSVYEDDL